MTDGEAGSLREAPDHARWTLADLASRTLSNVSSLRGAEPQVVRLELPVGLIEPFAWLGEQSLGPKLYWSGRRDGVEVAAVGAADLHEGEAPESPASLRKRLAPLLAAGDPRLRYYGGLRFDPDQTPSREWAAFGGFRFQLPRFELNVRVGEATLACNLVLPRDAERAEEILGEIEALSFSRTASEATPPEPVSRTDTPGYPEWRRNIGRALAAFDEGRLDKAVLARGRPSASTGRWIRRCSPGTSRTRRRDAFTSTWSRRTGWRSSGRRRNGCSGARAGAS
jgi:menaquinone-specific isochorismate synthase